MTSAEAARALGISRRELYRTVKRIDAPDQTHERHGQKLLFYPRHIQAIRFVRANGWKVENTRPKKEQRPHGLSKHVGAKSVEQVIDELKRAGVRTTKRRKK